MSDEQVIAQFVDRMHDEYTKVEVMQKTLAANHNNNDTPEDELTTQIVAAWDGKSKLNNAEFVRVSCRELNASGISFWIGHPPTRPFFVVVFKMSDETAFFKTRISDARPDSTMDNESYLVRTEFEGRVEPKFMP